MQPQYRSARTAGQSVVKDPLYAEGGNRADSIGWAPYFVSALASDKALVQAADSNWWSAVADVFAHLTIWIVAFVYEVNVYLKAESYKSAAVPDTRTFPFALASLVCFITPLSIVVFSFMVHIAGYMNWACGSKIAPGNYFPFLTSIIEGGLTASILFTFICVIYTVGVAAASNQWRDETIILLIMKICASAFINANVRRALNRDH
jgi:hypothetical protein